jgi:hypothetical protein
LATEAGDPAIPSICISTFISKYALSRAYEGKSDNCMKTTMNSEIEKEI